MCELTTGWILEKCPKSSVCTYHNMDFRKNAEHLMCELTTEWILESAQCFSVCTYRYFGITFYGSGAENYSFLGVRGNLDTQKGAACSYMTLYGEGSNASSTNKASDLSPNSGERRNSDAQKGATCS